MLPIIKLINEGDINNCHYEKLNKMEVEFIKANYLNNSMWHIVACIALSGIVSLLVFNSLSLTILAVLILSVIPINL